MVVVKHSWFKKGIAKLRSCQTPAGNSSGCRSGYRAIGLPGFLHGEDKPHQLLGCVGNGYIVVLFTQWTEYFSTFLEKTQEQNQYADPTEEATGETTGETQTEPYFTMEYETDTYQLTQENGV